MSECTPIEPGEICKGDTIRWERQGADLSYHPMQYGAVEYIAAESFHAYSAAGQHYLLHRPEPPRMALGWICDGVVVSDVNGLKRDVADGIPWEHGDDDFTEGVLVPKVEWDRIEEVFEAHRGDPPKNFYQANDYNRLLALRVTDLVNATRRMNGGDRDA